MAKKGQAKGASVTGGALEATRVCVDERLCEPGGDGAPVRLGIMGGTFDPIHLGHLACAEAAREACNLAKVLFIPTGNPSFKQGKQQASGERRVEMCKLATADNPAFEVSAIEVRREGVTYAVDTLRQLRAHYPENVEFFYIVGADTAVHLGIWREAAEIARLAQFVVVNRPKAELSAAVREALEAQGFRLHFVQAPALDISSSEVRERLAAGKSARYLLPDAVCDYLARQELYTEKGASLTSLHSNCHEELSEADILSDEFYAAREEELRDRVSKKRFAHIQGVAQTCAELAKRYGVDERRARLAGLLHDWDKGYDDAGIRNRARELGVRVDSWVFEHQPRIMHAYTAAAYFRQAYAHMPADVTQAIWRHTTAAPHMEPLDMVLYVADALEPNRRFGRVDELRKLAKTASLETLFVETLAYWTLLLLESGKTMHPDTVLVWNYYAMKNDKPFCAEAPKGLKRKENE